MTVQFTFWKVVFKNIWLIFPKNVPTLSFSWNCWHFLGNNACLVWPIKELKCQFWAHKSFKTIILTWGQFDKIGQCRKYQCHVKLFIQFSQLSNLLNKADSQFSRKSYFETIWTAEYSRIVKSDYKIRSFIFINGQTNIGSYSLGRILGKLLFLCLW